MVTRDEKGTLRRSFPVLPFLVSAMDLHMGKPIPQILILYYGRVVVLPFRGHPVSFELERVCGRAEA